MKDFENRSYQFSNIFFSADLFLINGIIEISSKILFTDIKIHDMFFELNIYQKLQNENYFK